MDGVENIVKPMRSSPLVIVRPFPIPRAIWLNAQRIQVEMVEDIAHKDDAFGMSLYLENRIRLQKSTTSVPRELADIEKTYFHELVHWILHAMGENELGENEKFVDTFGRLLHQAIVMAED